VFFIFLSPSWSLKRIHAIYLSYKKSAVPRYRYGIN